MKDKYDAAGRNGCPMSDKWECDFTEDPVCPHCGHVERDAWEFDFGGGLEGDGEVTCGECEREYFCSRHVSVSYSTEPIKAKAGAK